MSLTSEQGDPDEQAVIDGISANFPWMPSWVRVGPGDDAAVLANGMVLCADCMVQDVHWDRRVAAWEIGYKLARTNLSDIAAMGAEARWALLSLSLPSIPSRDWIAEFSRGLAEGLGTAPLIGGDTTGSPGPIVASLTVGGQLVGALLTRSGARAGDDLWVSGNLGDAALAFVHPKPPASLWRAWVRPNPPLELGPALTRQGLATAAIDLSDGLAKDLARLCAASGVGAEIQPSRLPLSEHLDANHPDRLPLQVSWGEDYELLFSAGPADRGAIRSLATRLGLRLTRIGHCPSGSQVRLEGQSWPESWSHFHRTPPQVQ
jgi:thiamine-monophosphate kinase